MTVTLTRHQKRSQDRKQCAAVRSHVTAVQRAISLMNGEVWFLDEENITSNTAVLYGQGPEQLVFAYDVAPKQGTLTVTGVHPWIEDGANQSLTMSPDAGVTTIAATLLQHLRPGHEGELNFQRLRTLCVVCAQRASRDLAEDLAGLCGGDIESDSRGLKVIFDHEELKGSFRIAESGRLSLNLESTDADVLCELAARLPNLRAR